MNWAQRSMSQAGDGWWSLHGRRNRSIGSSVRSRGYFVNSYGGRRQSHKGSSMLGQGHLRNSRIALRSEVGGHTLAITERGRKRTVRHSIDSLYKASGLATDRPDVRYRRLWSVPAKISSSVSRKAPALFIKTLFETWQVTSHDAAILLGLDKRAATELLAGAVPNGRDLKDRIVCLYQIRKNLWALFQDNEVENEWLREPHAALEGQSPLDLLCEGSMENMLLVKEYVNMTAGL